MRLLQQWNKMSSGCRQPPPTGVSTDPLLVKAVQYRRGKKALLKSQKSKVYGGKLAYQPSSGCQPPREPIDKFSRTLDRGTVGQFLFSITRLSCPYRLFF